MIKAEELRLNNLVAYKGAVIKVTIIGEHGIQSKEYDRTINAKFATPDIEGIPLTEEWLLRLGFKKDWENYYVHPEFNQLRDYGGQGVYLNGKNPTFVRCGYYENEIDCEFVHTLQNLFYALTGSELNIK